MKMFFTAFRVFLCVMCLGVASLAHANWSTMTQGEKNAAILNAAAIYPEGASGGECFVWAQNMVKQASGNPNILTGTWAGPTYWWYQNGHIGVYSGDIADAAVQPGMIVQMLMKKTSVDFPGGLPHTFIIGAKDANGFIIHHSNWYGDGVVHHQGPITYDYFRSLLKANYTYSIYYIY